MFHAEFKGLGNPDYQQYTDISAPKEVSCETVEQVVEAARGYITANNLGGGNWNNPQITDDRGKDHGYIAYNGRVF